MQWNEDRVKSLRKTAKGDSLPFLTLRGLPHRSTTACASTPSKHNDTRDGTPKYVVDSAGRSPPIITKPVPSQSVSF